LLDHLGAQQEVVEHPKIKKICT